MQDFIRRVSGFLLITFAVLYLGVKLIYGS